MVEVAGAAHLTAAAGAASLKALVAAGAASLKVAAAGAVVALLAAAAAGVEEAAVGVAKEGPVAEAGVVTTEAGEELQLAPCEAAVVVVALVHLVEVAAVRREVAAEAGDPRQQLVKKHGLQPRLASILPSVVWTP